MLTFTLAIGQWLYAIVKESRFHFVFFCNSNYFQNLVFVVTSIFFSSCPAIKYLITCLNFTIQKYLQNNNNRAIMNVSKKMHCTVPVL